MMMDSGASMGRLNLEKSASEMKGPAADVVPEQESGLLLSEEEEIQKGHSLKGQLTPRSLLLGIVIGLAMTIIMMNLLFSTGVAPSLNIASGLLGFVFMRFMVKMLSQCVTNVMPTSPQENTVIQTFAVALSSTVFSMGYGTYLLGMSENIATFVGGPAANQYINLDYGTIVAIAFCVLFTGLFFLLMLRNRMVITLGLLYPSGTATANMINGFFASGGKDLAKKQFGVFAKYFSISFLFDVFKWPFGAEGCQGFDDFPLLGYFAAEAGWSWDWSINYIGVGMICPHIVNYSMMFGAIFAYGILFPYIDTKKGIWYAADADGMDGKQGYVIFSMVAIIVGDGVYQICKMVFVSVKEIVDAKTKKTGTLPGSGSDLDSSNGNESEAREERIRKAVFRQDVIPFLGRFGSMASSIGGYIIFAIIGIIAFPYIVPTKFYIVLTAYLLVPFFAIPNSYLMGLTDWDMSAQFAKLALFILAGWNASIDPNEGVLAGLAVCGIVLAGASQACVLMQDFKTGYLTKSSPRAMFYAQLIGTFLGAFIVPAIFILFTKAFPDLGLPGSTYSAPYGRIYRGMAILGTEGFNALPYNLSVIMAGLFGASFVLCLVREAAGLWLEKGGLAQKLVLNLVPVPAAMSIPFAIGPALAISMSTGSVIRYIWARKDPEGEKTFSTSLASGLIAGDGLFALPKAFLALGGLTPPICITYSLKP